MGGGLQRLPGGGLSPAYVTHLLSDSLMAVNCSGGSGPSSSTTHTNRQKFNDIELQFALLKYFKTTKLKSTFAVDSFEMGISTSIKSSY
jgi:hypothetical protein